MAATIHKVLKLYKVADDYIEFQIKLTGVKLKNSTLACCVSSDSLEKILFRGHDFPYSVHTIIDGETFFKSSTITNTTLHNNTITVTHGKYLSFSVDKKSLTDEYALVSLQGQTTTERICL